MSTHNMPFINITKENHHNYHKSALDEFFPGTPERVRNSSGKRAISVRATEVLLYKFNFRYLKVEVRTNHRRLKSGPSVLLKYLNKYL